MGSAEDLHFEIETHDAPVADAERSALIADPGFGKIFTDHMVTIRYSTDRGWYDARIHARRPLMLDPACAVLHYAQEIFEGLKAYRLPDGGELQLSREDYVAPKGRRIEAAGIEPDIVVPRLLRDIRAGRDADLETALRILREPPAK